MIQRCRSAEKGKTLTPHTSINFDMSDGRVKMGETEKRNIEKLLVILPIGDSLEEQLETISEHRPSRRSTAPARTEFHWTRRFTANIKLLTSLCT